MSLVVLAPEMSERTHQRLLHSLLTSSGLRDYTTVESWDATTPGDVVVSVGKAALDCWHQWGLVQVGNQRGQVFAHDGRTIMVIEHPGTMMQLGWVGRDAKTHAKAHLSVLAQRIDHPDVLREGMAMAMCGKCQSSRVKGGGGRARYATHWPTELDCAGLCDEHYRTRGRIKSRWTKPRVDKSKKEAQIQGQREMFAGDGRTVVMRK